MQIRHWLPLILLTAISCHPPAHKSPVVQPLGAADTTKATPQPEDSPPKNDTVRILKTHLRDTTFAAGNFILFLEPDEARYAELNNDPDGGLGDADSDFGVGMTNTEDSVAKNNKYKDISVLVSTSRYICIKDCKDGPLINNRDSVNYGYILSGRGRAITTSYNSVHSGDYLGEIDDYFFGH
jgi:hypothetical protein